MPRKEEFDVFTFDELSPKAKKRAIEDFRDDPELTWDDTDSDMLTETFEQDLKDHYGLGDLKVGWSLSYCQGDGVCFSGTVTIPEFLEREKEEKQFARVLRLAEEGSISAKISHESRYCYPTSMDIEIQNFSREEELIPKDLRKRVDEWENWREEILDKWRREREAVVEKNWAPVRAWEDAVESFGRKIAQGPREWTPRGPGQKPEPLKNPLPPEPVILVPEWVKEAREKAEADYLVIENEIKEFEKYLGERIEEIAREMEKNGYDEMDYHRKDEYITEILENNDWEYLKTGERWER